jgi:hypothetical protein
MVQVLCYGPEGQGMYPDKVIEGVCNLPNHSSLTLALELTRPLTALNT